MASRPFASVTVALEASDDQEELQQVSKKDMEGLTLARTLYICLWCMGGMHMGAVLRLTRISWMKECLVFQLLDILLSVASSFGYLVWLCDSVCVSGVDRLFFLFQSCNFTSESRFAHRQSSHQSCDIRPTQVSSLC